MATTRIEWKCFEIRAEVLVRGQQSASVVDRCRGDLGVDGRDREALGSALVPDLGGEHVVAAMQGQKRKGRQVVDEALRPVPGGETLEQFLQDATDEDHFSGFERGGQGFDFAGPGGRVAPQGERPYRSVDENAHARSRSFLWS